MAHGAIYGHIVADVWLFLHFSGGELDGHAQGQGTKSLQTRKVKSEIEGVIF